jgi:hypothetical protein
VLISSHRELLWSKASVVNVAEKLDTIPSGMVEGGERKRTAVEVSKADFRACGGYSGTPELSRYRRNRGAFTMT